MADANKPRMKDLAAELGLNASTVSRALRGDPRIRPATQDRVKALAEKRGYQMHAAASALADTRWTTGSRVGQVNFGFLGVAASDAKLKAHSDYRQIKRAAEARGFELVPLALNADSSPRLLNRRLRAQNIQGVIMGPMDLKAANLEAFEWAAIEWERSAWVAVREGGYAPSCHQVLFNAFSNTQRALKELVDLRFRRIAFVHAPASSSRVNHRQQAALLSFGAQNPAVECYEIPGSSPEAWKRAFSGLQPDVMLYAYDSIRDQMEDVYRSLPWASLNAVGSVAGIVKTPESMASAAIDLLEMLYRRGQYGLPENRQKLMLECPWQDGATLIRS